MKRILLIAYLITIAAGVQAVKQYRDFTDTKGRTIRGCIVSYDAKKGIVSFERDNRKISKVPVTVFSESDQAYIREWEVLRCFSMERFLKVSAKRKQTDNDSKSYSSSYKSLKVEDTGYEIQIENRSTSNFSGLKLEYCIYYEQDKIQSGGNITDQGVFFGDISIDSIASKSKITLQTKTVSTYMKELGSGAVWTDGSENVQRGGIHGLWIRIHMIMPSGEETVRDICFPSSLSNGKAWMTSSIRAGMN